MSFEVHELIINFFFFELKKDPLEGFSPVTLAQLASADRELHVRLAELTRAGLHPGPNGQLPLDEHVKTLLNGPELRWMLMPMPRRQQTRIETHAPPKKETDPKRTRDDPASNKKNAAEAAKLKRLRRTPMPKQFRGGTPCDDSGKPYCFAFNLGSCQNGDDCKRGMHMCCKKGCGKKHSYVSAHKGS